MYLHVYKYQKRAKKADRGGREKSPNSLWAMCNSGFLIPTRAHTYIAYCTLNTQTLTPAPLGIMVTRLNETHEQTWFIMHTIQMHALSLSVSGFFPPGHLHHTKNTGLAIIELKKEHNSGLLMSKECSLLIKDSLLWPPYVYSCAVCCPIAVPDICMYMYEDWIKLGLLLSEVKDGFLGFSVVSMKLSCAGSLMYRR